MTKEKALFILYQRCKNNPEAEEALDFLKKSVTQKSTECGDAISRDAVLKKIDYEVEHYCKYLEEVDDKRNAQTHVALLSDNIREEVEQLPSVTQKSGKWIDHSYEEGYVECPFCGHATTCEDNIDELHYCFYCGARMVEPQERSE